jgi:MOSC domain-containing protein YiiM
MTAQEIKTIGRVAAIAIRPEKNAPMRELEEVGASAGAGLAGDVSSIPDRGVTLISKSQWDEVCGELDAALPWHTRRANILVEADALGHLIGKRIRIGDVEVDLKLEVNPCGLMDKQHQGLRAALVPDCRGGVGGKILNNGTISRGDTVVLLD